MSYIIQESRTFGGNESVKHTAFNDFKKEIYGTQRIEEIVVFHNTIISGFEVKYGGSKNPRTFTELHGSKPALNPNQIIKRTTVPFSADQELYAVSGITGGNKNLDTKTEFVFQISFLIRNTKTGEFDIQKFGGDKLIEPDTKKTFQSNGPIIAFAGSVQSTATNEKGIKFELSSGKIHTPDKRERLTSISFMKRVSIARAANFKKSNPPDLEADSKTIYPELGWVLQNQKE